MKLILTESSLRLRSLARLTALLLLPSCAAQPMANSQDQAEIESMVGRDYWLNVPAGQSLNVCLTPRIATAEKECRPAASGKFRIIKVVKGDDGQQVFEIEIERGKRRGYFPVQDRAYFVTEKEMQQQQEWSAVEQRTNPDKR